MKKILILIISLLIVGCNSSANSDITECSKTIDEPIQIERLINLHSKDNLITKVTSSEKFYFSEEFTAEMFSKLEKDMKERHLESKNLTFESEVLEDYAVMTITLADVDKAEAPELMLIGISEDDAEFLPGLIETVRFNENAGYTCKVVED